MYFSNIDTIHATTQHHHLTKNDWQILRTSSTQTSTLVHALHCNTCRYGNQTLRTVVVMSVETKAENVTFHPSHQSGGMIPDRSHSNLLQKSEIMWHAGLWVFFFFFLFPVQQQVKYGLIITADQVGKWQATVFPCKSMNSPLKSSLTELHQPKIKLVLESIENQCTPGVATLDKRIECSEIAVAPDKCKSNYEFVWFAQMTGGPGPHSTYESFYQKETGLSLRLLHFKLCDLKVFGPPH